MTEYPLCCDAGWDCVYDDVYSWFGCFTGTASTACDVFTACVIVNRSMTVSRFQIAMMTPWSRLVSPPHLFVMAKVSQEGSSADDHAP
jgi:hypothetical protein